MNVIAIPIVLFILVALVCLLVGVIVLAIHAYRSRGVFGALAVIGTVVLVPGTLLLFLAFFGVQKVEMANQEVLRNEAIASTIAGNRSRSSQNTTDDRFAARPLEPVVVSAYPQPRPGQWSSMNHDEFRANLYPSLLEAAEPLAQQTADAMKEAEWINSAENPAREVFYVVGEPSFLDEQLAFRSAFARRLEQELKDAEVVTIADDAQPEKTAGSPITQPIQIRLSANVEQTNRSQPWDPSTMDAPGRISAVVTSDRGALETRLRFVDKPWVHHLDQVVSAFPSKKFLVGYSDKLASTEAEARESAIANARSQVDVRTRFGAMVVLDDSHVIDRFAQKLSRPYGDVWREAVLIDLADLTVNASAAAANVAVSHGENVRISSVFAVVLLILTTTVVCFVANFLTQGYHRRSIGWFACLLGALIVAAVVALNTIA